MIPASPPATDGVPARPRGRLATAVARRLPALANAPFRRYVFGVLLADGATFMFAVTASWLVYELTAPPFNVAFVLGVLGFCRTVPMLAFVLAGGIAADRLGRRRMLMATNGASALIAVLCALGAAAGALTVWALLAAAFAMGVAMAFNRPSHQAFIRDLAGATDTHNAVALVALVSNTVRIGAPLLAGALLAIGAAPAALALVATGFAGMMLLLVRVPPPARATPVAAVAPGRFTASLREVFGYIRSQPLVRGMVLITTIPGLLALPYISLLPIFAEGVYGRGAGGLGLMQSVIGAGALAGAFALTLLSGVRRRGWLVLGGIAAFGLALVVLGRVEWWPLALVMLMLAGMSDVFYFFTINGILLSTAPDHLRGRVMSVYTMADIGLSPVGSLIVGGVAGLVGAQAAIALSGALVMLCVGVAAARFPRLRQV